MHSSDSRNELLKQISRKHTRKWRCNIIQIAIRVIKKQKQNSRKSMRHIRCLVMRRRRKIMISSEMRISQDSDEVLAGIHLVEDFLVVLRVLILVIYFLSLAVLVVVVGHLRVLTSILEISSEVWVVLRGEVGEILNQRVMKNPKNPIISMSQRRLRFLFSIFSSIRVSM